MKKKVACSVFMIACLAFALFSETKQANSAFDYFLTTDKTGVNLFAPQSVNAVTGSIPVQGRLTDSNGSPLSGDYLIKFSLYTVATGGSPVCSDISMVHVTKGLYAETIDGCSQAIFNGNQLYLGVTVGDDPEMTPRQQIFPVTYAMTLKPGANISGEGTGLTSPTLTLNNSSPTGISLWAHNTSTSNTDATLVVSNDGFGPLIKGFGGDGGDYEFIVTNSGEIYTTADTHIFVPGNQVKLGGYSSSPPGLYSFLNEIYVDPTSPEEYDLLFGITLPGVLYGRAADIEEVKVCYQFVNGGSILASYISGWSPSTGENVYLTTSYDIRSSTTATCYTIPVDPDYQLQSGEGFITVDLKVAFPNPDTQGLYLSGVELVLGHAEYK